MHRATLAAFLLVSAGCASTNDQTVVETSPAEAAAAPQPEQAEQQAPQQAQAQQQQQRAQQQRRRRGPEFGAVDADTRRTTGDSTVDIFARLDLPTGTEMRLGSGAPGPDWWQQRCDYDIDATIDPEARRLEASMTVTYHNNSPHELDFHLAPARAEPVPPGLASAR